MYTLTLWVPEDKLRQGAGLLSFSLDQQGLGVLLHYLTGRGYEVHERNCRSNARKAVHARAFVVTFGVAGVRMAGGRKPQKEEWLAFNDAINSWLDTLEGVSSDVKAPSYVVRIRNRVRLDYRAGDYHGLESRWREPEVAKTASCGVCDGSGYITEVDPIDHDPPQRVRCGECGGEGTLPC